MESLLEKKPTLSECRAAVTESEEARSSLAKRLESLILQKKSLEAGLSKFESERSDCINGIARGQRSGADLAKVRKAIDKDRDDLQDTSEIIDVVKQSLETAELDLVEKKKSLRREEERFWRGVVSELKSQHSAEINKLFLMMYVAIISSGPGGGCPIFHLMGQVFDLSFPRADTPAGKNELECIKLDLEERFKFFES